MFNQRLKNKVLRLETRIYNNDYGWSSHDKRIRELYERISKVENQRGLVSNNYSLRLDVIEDAITEIAKALDAYGIDKPCKSCGQKLPKEKSK
jgi:DNA repair exonuclease SbcCD ATPase subunit